MRADIASPSVDELQRAWAAVHAGHFRVSTAERSTILSAWTPEPHERVLPVLGCTGSAGSTTIALAIALAASVGARVIECCSADKSGLAAASDAELGLPLAGWRQGDRDTVILERASQVLLSASEVPVPVVTSGITLTVVDLGWELRQLLGSGGWLREVVSAAESIVVVTPATVPGLRRLEGVVELLGVDRTVAGIVGPPIKKWPKSVVHGAGRTTRVLLDQRRLVAIPRTHALAIAGLDSTPLPAPLITAATQLLALTHATNQGEDPCA